MTRGWNIALYAIAFSAMCGGAFAQGASSTQIVELSSNVRDELSKLPKRDVSTAQLKTLKIDIDAGSGITKAEKSFEFLGNGLVGVTEVLPAQNSQARSLTLQGIVELVWTMEVLTSGETVIPLPGAKAFLPFGVSRTIRTSVVRKTNTLSGELPALVVPTPQIPFSFEQTTDTELSRKGLLSLTSNFRNETKISCTVQAAADAKAIHPKLMGQYLPVTCEGKDPKGPPFVREFAYVIDSHLYILLSTTGRDRRETHKITDVEYAPR